MRCRIMAVLLSLSAVMSGCYAQEHKSEGTYLRVAATTTMLADLAGEIGGDRVLVSGLMGPGVDPHLYQASAGDVEIMRNADVVIYNGLHLEGKMGEIFESLSAQGKTVICIGSGIDKDLLIERDGAYDPHIWFDVSLWKRAAEITATGLAKADLDGSGEYMSNLESYIKELDELDAYVKSRAGELSDGQRVLVTAHDAFSYFGRAYGFEVCALQGISTNAEASAADVSRLAGFIADRKIRAVFAESSVPPKNIEALLAAVRARGFDAAEGGLLYSDSLGDESANTETYILTVKANIDTIVNSLKGNTE